MVGIIFTIPSQKCIAVVKEYKEYVTAKDDKTNKAGQVKKLWLKVYYFSLNLSCNPSFQESLPSLKPMLEEVEQCFLHHVRNLVAFEWRPHQHNRSHTWHNVVRRRRLLLFEKRLPFLLGRGSGERCLPSKSCVAQRVWILTYIFTV